MSLFSSIMDKIFHRAPKPAPAPAAAGAAPSAAPAASAPQAAPAGFLQRVRQGLDAPTRALENGAFLGLGDRARALIDSVVGGNTSYSANLAKERSDTDTFAAAHPVANAALGVVGGALAPIGGQLAL